MTTRETMEWTPKKIKVFVRSDSSGTTEIFKNTPSEVDPMFNVYFGIANT